MGIQQKFKFIVLTLQLLIMTNHSWANNCLKDTMDFLYDKYGFSLEEARDQAFEFCRTGGKISCLTPAEQMIFNSCSTSLESARSQAIDFCKRGANIICVQQMKSWLVQTVGEPLEVAFQKSLNYCRDLGEISCLKTTYAQILKTRFRNDKKEAANLAIYRCSQVK